MQVFIKQYNYIFIFSINSFKKFLRWEFLLKNMRNANRKSRPGPYHGTNEPNKIKNEMWGRCKLFN
jgi:hypothetical protein